MEAANLKKRKTCVLDVRKASTVSKNCSKLYPGGKAISIDDANP